MLFGKRWWLEGLSITSVALTLGAAPAAAPPAADSLGARSGPAAASLPNRLLPSGPTCRAGPPAVVVEYMFHGPIPAGTARFLGKSATGIVRRHERADSSYAAMRRVAGLGLADTLANPTGVAAISYLGSLGPLVMCTPEGDGYSIAAERLLRRITRVRLRVFGASGDTIARADAELGAGDVLIARAVARGEPCLLVLRCPYFDDRGGAKNMNARMEAMRGPGGFVFPRKGDWIPFALDTTSRAPR